MLNLLEGKLDLPEQHVVGGSVEGGVLNQANLLHTVVRMEVAQIQLEEPEVGDQQEDQGAARFRAAAAPLPHRL